MLDVVPDEVGLEEYNRFVFSSDTKAFRGLCSVQNCERDAYSMRKTPGGRKAYCRAHTICLFADPQFHKHLNVNYGSAERLEIVDRMT